jgi:hypothetical protein
MEQISRMINYGEWQILPGSWSAQLNFVRSGNTASLDLKTILYLLTISKKVMVKMLDIMVEFIIFIISPFWKFISQLGRSLVSPKLSRAHGYSVYMMKKDSESLIRSKSFDLDQKIHHLASTCICNKIMELFLAFPADPLAVCLFRLSAENQQWRRKTVSFQS